MLTIRKDQMQVLSEYMLQMYKARMVTHLRATFTGQLEKMTDAALQELIETGIGKAESYGITMEKDVQTFLEYMVIYSPDFDTNPETSWAGDILCRKDIESVLKMARLRETVAIRREA